MNTTHVKIVRIRKVTIKEYILIPVIQDEKSFKAAETLAKNLVLAQLAAGHSIDWREESATDQTFPEPEIFVEYPEIAPVKPPAAPDRDGPNFHAGEDHV